jgi:hypothetical protein
MPMRDRRVDLPCQRRVAAGESAAPGIERRRRIGIAVVERQPCATRACIDDGADRRQADVAARRMAEWGAALRVAVDVDRVPIGGAEDRTSLRTADSRVGVLDEKPHRRRVDDEGSIGADAREVMAGQPARFVLADRLAIDRHRVPFAERQRVARVEAAELIARLAAPPRRVVAVVVADQRRGK